MPDDLPPSLFELLRGDIRDMRADFNARIDKLVSTDAFTAEQRRRDEQYGELVKDIQEERAAREKAIAAERDARVKAHEDTDRRSSRAWAAVKWVLGTLIAVAAVAVAAWAVVAK